MSGFVERLARHLAASGASPALGRPGAALGAAGGSSAAAGAAAAAAGGPRAAGEPGAVADSPGAAPAGGSGAVVGAAAAGGPVAASAGSPVAAAGTAAVAGSSGMADAAAVASGASPASGIASSGVVLRRAAVAAVLHEEPGEPRVLLMKRIEWAGDPWSGHISLPGGGYQASDASLLETAIRETLEELGVDLSSARLLGSLPPLHPRAAGPRGIEVTPFVFATETAPEPICGPEALSAFWLPLSLAASGALDEMYTYPSTQASFPSWRYEGHVIWGLTWRILGDLLAAGREP